MKKHISLFAVLMTIALWGCKKSTIPFEVADIISVNDVTFTGATIECYFDKSKVPVAPHTSCQVSIGVSRISPVTSNNWDEYLNVTNEESGTLLVTFKGLQPNTKYYARPYMYIHSNENGFTRYYGEEVEFVTKKVPGGGGLLDGEFSVSETKNVRFTSGNLQYVNYGKYWLIAANQYDCIGNGQCYQGRDLFGWGDLTGSNASTDNADYLWTKDWGSLFDDDGLSLRTLKRSEWTYLLGYGDDEPCRPNADSLVGMAKIGLMNGMVILPDNWVTPEGLHFYAGLDYSPYDPSPKTNSCTIEEWQLMEAAGAVFLPATDTDTYHDIDDCGYGMWGRYWSSSIFSIEHAWGFQFYKSGRCSIYYKEKHEDKAVRLVMDVN